MSIQDTFNTFFTTWNGKPAEAEDPTNKDQCMDLIFFWVDALQVPREAVRHLYAYQVFTEPNDLTRQYFDLIPNTPTGIPQVGDIVVFNTQVGIAGHVCISDGKGTVSWFESFDQNWAGKQYGSLVQHQYWYNGQPAVLGWLRFKPQLSDVVNKKDLINKIIAYLDTL